MFFCVFSGTGQQICSRFFDHGSPCCVRNGDLLTDGPVQKHLIQVYQVWYTCIRCFCTFLSLKSGSACMGTVLRASWTLMPDQRTFLSRFDPFPVVCSARKTVPAEHCAQLLEAVLLVWPVSSTFRTGEAEALQLKGT